MTTTPTVWKAPFIAYGSALSGSQSRSQTIGLANGNMLVFWEDNIQGPSPFIDVMAQLLDAQGNAIGGIFQANTAIVGSDETEPKAVALPDGGYVLAYGSYLEAIGGFITVQRFDAAGNSVRTSFIQDPLSSLTKWQVTADSVGNYTVAYERLAGHIASAQNPTVVYSPDVFAVTYDSVTDAVSPEHSNVAQNSGADDRLASVATLPSGAVVTFYTEPDFDFFNNRISTAEFTITDPFNGATLRGPTEISGSFGDQAVARDVIALAGGQAVLIYAHDGNYAFKIVAGQGSSSNISFEHNLITSGALGGIHAVALHDGGFFLAWLETDSLVLYGQRYDANGTAIGARLPVAEAVHGFAPNNLALTSDGRILATFTGAVGEINEIILDPRDNNIFGTEGRDVLTSQTTSSIVHALGGNDVVYGQGGNDRIDGGTGADSLFGGSGSDTYVLADVHSSLTSPKLFYDSITEFEGAGTDTVEVMSFLRASRVSPLPSGYALGVNVENGLVTGQYDFGLTGNELANRLTGNDAANALMGMSGNDRLSGRGGNDFLDGGDGLDTADYSEKTSAVRVTLNGAADAAVTIGGVLEDTIRNIENLIGGATADVLVGDALGNSLSGLDGNDILSGGAGLDRLTGGDGTDVYYADLATDLVIESNAVPATGGNDLVYFLGLSGTFTLSANVERLVLRGAAAINGTGNSLANTIIGNGAANVINGGLGNDVLTGGLGNDTFRFDTLLAANIDTITDFNVAADTIQLENAIFIGLTAGAVITAGQFHDITAAAQDADDKILYNHTTGNLTFDSNGLAAGGQTVFAHVTANTALTNLDFFVT
jgi:Ca2+-binding RTX toxin-like protein